MIELDENELRKKSRMLTNMAGECIPDGVAREFLLIEARLSDLEKESTRLRKILSHIPARVVIAAKEAAGYPVAIQPSAKPRPSTGHPDVPVEYRCNICGGLVRFDGTKPAIYYSPERGGKR